MPLPWPYDSTLLHEEQNERACVCVCLRLCLGLGMQLACHPSPQVRLVAADAVDRAVILGLTCSCGALPNGGALLPAGSLPSQLGRAGALGGAGVGGGGDRGGPGQTWEADLLRVGRQSSLPEPWAEASIGVLEGKYRDPLPGLLEGVPQGDLGEPGSRGLNGGGGGVGGGGRDGERDVEAMVVGTVEALFSCAGDSETKAAALRILLHVMEVQHPASNLPPSSELPAPFLSRCCCCFCALGLCSELVC